MRHKMLVGLQRLLSGKARVVTLDGSRLIGLSLQAAQDGAQLERLWLSVLARPTSSPPRRADAST
jgi:hypothetical protein